MPLIAAVVATHNRPQLLANRSLLSIAGQSRPPDYLVVVDDSDPETRRTNREIVADYRVEGTNTVYLENYRTPGVAGAWNTALSELQATEPSVFVAILDDDDSWDSSYLRRCEEEVLRAGLDMVATGIVYHRSVEHEGWPLEIPTHLDVNEFLVGNPHIQGSNLFVRLRKLLEAGGFDEGLQSTTDRDMCIRLADLGTVRYGALTEHLVHHYAEDGRSRLSSFGGDAKCSGLQYFYRKYRSRMSDEQRLRFLERSRERFGCDADVTAPQTYHLVSAPRSQNVDGHLELVVGVITSPEVANIANLLDDLIDRIAYRDDVTLKVVLLENGGHDEDSRSELRQVVQKAVKRGLEIGLKTLEEQKTDTGTGRFSATEEQLSGRKSIALSRTMLQHYLFLEAKPRQGSVVWILDDDARLEGLRYGPDGAIGAEEVDYISDIKLLKETESCVVIGEVTGEPPLPFLSSVRIQLVDLVHNLYQLAALSPHDLYPNRGDENRSIRLTHRDYYYDLSRSETDHLESPFWYEASDSGLSTAEVFAEMVSRLPEILSGRQVFRPLVGTSRVDPTDDPIPSVNRGPNTLVFDLQTLREFPNAVPCVDGADTRRSDMIWSLLNRFGGGCKVVSAPLPIRQDRGTVNTISPDFETLIQDIQGYALYSSLHDVFLRKTQERQRDGKRPDSHRLLKLDDEDQVDALRRYAKYIRERSRSFELSFLRITGVVCGLRHFCDPKFAGAKQAWWLKSREHESAVTGLRRFVSTLEVTYRDEQLKYFQRRTSEMDTRRVAEYLRNLPKIVDRHRSNTPLPRQEMRYAAEQYVTSEFATKQLYHLGTGEEGVVLTDGRLVYKYFHYWKARDRGRQIAFLQSLAGKLAEYRTLPDISELRVRGDHAVAIYPYDPGKVYEGGHLDGMLTLLRECREVGIACRNVHPDNLIVASSGLKLIDFGSDIVPFNDRDFEQMCRRAFLSYRFHFRSDLKQLMTAALTDRDLPELSGFDHFLAALDPSSTSEALNDLIVEKVAESGARSVFDYGCGSGRLASMLARYGRQTAAFDPDRHWTDRWQLIGADVDFLSREQVDTLIEERESYDAVVCSRVICDIEDFRELDSVLRDLRWLVSDTGTVLVAVCNPFNYAVERTEGHIRCARSDQSYDSVFTYKERDAAGGEWRREVHRSMQAYRRSFHRAGLTVDRVIELPTSDTGNLRPASDYMLFLLRPAVDTPSVSLLIKTCYMEWRTIERLVRHQVGQLEGPVGFAEKVVLVDPFEGPFPRQYDDPDRDAHRAATERLVEDGVVDRVINVPQDPETIRRAYTRWFGVESDQSHTTNGQQLFATIYGFEQCRGDYVLQVDSDILISRTDRQHNFLGEMVEVFRRDPAALFVPPSICRAAPLPYTDTGRNGDWRVEVRVCLFDKRRLLSQLPIANELEGDRLAMGWHRAFDRVIASGEHHSYRGGDPRTAFIHVPNEHKTKFDELFETINAVERGYVPSIQNGSVDLVGSAADWAGPKRREQFVFVICGRNVEPGKFRACFDSLVAQSHGNWGAIVVDDASTNGFGDYAELLTSDYAERFTLIRNETRRGGLYNLWDAVTKFCPDPETVIVTLDADDALIGPHVLDRVWTEYDDRADVTVGSMLRLDKESHYPVDFTNPRSWRSNVWQHLRTFGRYLFDAIDIEDLKLDEEWIDIATDWAYMVPIVEMASSPRYVPDRLYLYEPAEPSSQTGKQERDAIIARILAKPSYCRLDVSESQRSR